MTNSMTKTALLLMTLAACGGGDGDTTGDSDFDIPPGDDPGEGSATLLVKGRVDASELVNAATESTEFSSSFIIEITLNGEVIDDALVIVSSEGGSTPLAFNTSGTSGDFRGIQPGRHASPLRTGQ